MLLGIDMEIGALCRIVTEMFKLSFFMNHLILPKVPCFTIISKERLSEFLCTHHCALEFSFLTSVEKLTLATVRGQLSYAVGNARALGSACAVSRNRCSNN